MRLFRKLVFLCTFIISVGLLFTACGNQKAAEPEPTPTNTTTQPATAVPTEIPETATTPALVATIDPAEASSSDGGLVVVEQGGFSFQSVPGFNNDVQENQVGIFSPDEEILLFMLVNQANPQKTMQEVLDEFVKAASADMGELQASEPESFMINGKEGLAVNVSGAYLGSNMEGKVAIVSPDEARTFVAFGLAVNDRWQSEGVDLFNTTLDSVSFTLQDSTADNGFSLQMPVGEPAAEWNDIPIMPEATAGEGDDQGYTFVVPTTAVEVQTFYEQELAKLGWSLLGVGDGENGMFLMVFQNRSEAVSVSLFAIDPNTTYVVIIK